MRIVKLAAALAIATCLSAAHAAQTTFPDKPIRLVIGSAPGSGPDIISRALADRAIAGFKVREDRIKQVLDKNPILVTALNPVIGYEKGAATAKQAYKEGRPIAEVAREMSGLSEKQLRELLDPLALTKGGIDDGAGSGG